jgi:hypothetical protein
MLIETKYNPQDVVFTVVGSDDKAFVVETKIASIEIEAISRGVKVIYHCSIDKQLLGTHLNGTPQFYSIPRIETALFLTEEECFASIIKKAK